MTFIRVTQGDVMRSIRLISKKIGAGLAREGGGQILLRELGAISRKRWETKGFGKWPALKASTRAARAARRGHYREQPASGVTASGPTLVWSARLRASLGDPRGRGLRDSVTRMLKTRLVWGTRTPYAEYHAEKRYELGRRYKILEITDRQERQLVGALEDWIGDDA